ncbi:MAG: tRNA lysidine(34) synthetase TilS [Hydrogenophilales bacterium CG03_land_8_20_14_0_80_62_28]|nr:MAG: tRNA lysidine(34) synthetase TilS [Hydrogenophilaceae bacterium CG1_02_62_390]PIV22800.1 MAG: tRNA lysidine(34) synthetase TilS [Hydrogenophilales bacterium CG03_land_8_20_14_0_80_62_28]PIW39479.1 MAG: tRNA lysidine(34) synthetase TilS [Hydrogenophilales bacterium CG15_BIG_FIL_POST_REV_8_21_14_020_62_31]PIW72693.1 MAG: tRNA lysidine(34) synthetase TilS [Hydrogenophilales bacterium CG12_big_fil_rev_8_21_14_0_65_61_21]PIX01490.1 MAG: tRNA lysidine(34) synthetase TilS [Hydrogenophilales ba
MASSRKPGSADLSGQVRDFLAPRLFPAARLCLGYSGGLDSTVLLHLLAGLRRLLAFRLTAVHVHHGLSPHADDWAAACQMACDRLDVPLNVRRVRVVVDGQGLEAAAREVRYAALGEQPADFILVAHHRDDQAETLLLRLLRGAGVHGLAAMAEDRALAGSRLLRPLLDAARDDLRRYARRHGLTYIDDESNADQALTRNWLRGKMLPEIEARFPACREILASTAARLMESAALLDDLARLDMADTAQGDSLDLAGLRRLAAARARNVLRYWLRERIAVTPSEAHLETLLSQLLVAGPDRQPVWRFGGKVLRRHRGRASLVADVGPVEGQWLWRGESELILADLGRLIFLAAVGEGLAADKLPAAGCTVGWRGGGEKLRPDCRRPRRTLKNLLREAGLPPDERLRLPLLSIAGQPVWMAGIGVDCAFQAGPGEAGWLIFWQPA